MYLFLVCVCVHMQYFGFKSDVQVHAGHVHKKIWQKFDFVEGFCSFVILLYFKAICFVYLQSLYWHGLISFFTMLCNQLKQLLKCNASQILMLFTKGSLQETGKVEALTDEVQYRDALVPTEDAALVPHASSMLFDDGEVNCSPYLSQIYKQTIA